MACAASHPRLVRAELFERGSFPVLSSLQTAGPYDAKPVSADLRKLLRVRFAVYMYGNTWSSSFKRVLLSGAVVLAPQPDPFSSMEAELMAGCKDCLLYYDAAPARMCDSILAAMASLSDQQAKERAERTRAFAYEALATPRVHSFMRATLALFPAVTRGTVVGNALVLQPAAGRALLPGGGSLNRSECGPTLAALQDGRHGWQLKQWFASNCRLNQLTEGSYLDYVAI